MDGEGASIGNTFDLNIGGGGVDPSVGLLISESYIYASRTFCHPFAFPTLPTSPHYVSDALFLTNQVRWF